jgi:hypothetical protein
MRNLEKTNSTKSSLEQNKIGIFHNRNYAKLFQQICSSSKDHKLRKFGEQKH